MSAATNEEKARKRIDQVKRRRKAIQNAMRRDVRVLRAIIRGESSGLPSAAAPGIHQ